MDHPTQLTNALSHSSGPVASYPHIHPTTEEYITPFSLAFTTSGTHFVAGSNSLISIFDVTRTNEGPVEKHQTIPSRKAVKVEGGVGFRGILSCLDISSDRLLAAGSFNRFIDIYTEEGRGERATVFHLAPDDGSLDSPNSESVHRARGTGITQVKWSSCGTYLYVAERRSDVILLYDIRVAGKRLSVLRGRRADTNQRLGFDITAIDGGEGHEVWAGGTDGRMRVWTKPYLREGDIAPEWDLEAHKGKRWIAPELVNGLLTFVCRSYCLKYCSSVWICCGDLCRS